MKRMLVVLIGCILSLGACVSVPPPDITSVDYRNYDYEFYVKIPDGWTHVSLADSKKFFNVTPTLLGPDIIAYFGKPSSDLSLLIIAATRSTIDPALFLCFVTETDLNKEYKKQFEQMQSSLKSNNLSVDCRQEIDKKRYTLDAANHTYTVTCDVQPQQKDQKPFKLRTEDYFYRCNEDDTCSLRFVMASAEGDYTKNMEALVEMTENLQHIIPPKPQK